MKRKPNLPWRKIDDEGIILSAGKDEAHIVNDTAIMIWEMLDGSYDLEDISGALCDRYGIDKETARNDVLEFVGQLRQRGLME